MACTTLSVASERACLPQHCLQTLPRASSQLYVHARCFPITCLALTSSTSTLVSPLFPQDVFAAGGARNCAISDPVPLARLRQIKAKVNGTINDVLVAAISGAMARYLEARGDATAENVRMRAMFPLNSRPLKADISKTFGNRFVIMSMQMPVHISDPVKRLQESKALCDDMKVSPQTPIVAALNEFALSTMPVDAYVDTTLKLFTKASFLFTNVIGPATQATMDGIPVTDLMFWVPSPTGIVFSIVSYNNRINLGVCGPPAVLVCLRGVHAPLW